MLSILIHVINLKIFVKFNSHIFFITRLKKYKFKNHFFKLNIARLFEESDRLYNITSSEAVTININQSKMLES